MQSSQFDLLQEYQGTSSPLMTDPDQSTSGSQPRLGEMGMGLGGGQEVRAEWGGLKIATGSPLQGSPSLGIHQIDWFEDFDDQTEQMKKDQLEHLRIMLNEGKDWYGPDWFHDTMRILRKHWKEKTAYDEVETSQELFKRDKL